MYPRIAAELRAQIASGELPLSAQLPTHKQLAEQHSISVGTAHRVTALLSSEGLVGVAGPPSSGILSMRWAKPHVLWTG